jgi:hypothetical protein
MAYLSVALSPSAPAYIAMRSSSPAVLLGYKSIILELGFFHSYVSGLVSIIQRSVRELRTASSAANILPSPLC